MSLDLPHINRMRRYAVGAAPKNSETALKLNQNESPYPPSPLVQDALSEIGSEMLRCYPDESASELRQSIADLHGLALEETFCGNGSSELISLIMKVFVGVGGKVALPDPTFELYHKAAEGFQAETIRVPLHAHFEIDVGDLAGQCAQAIVLVNPNAPTGRLLDLGSVERLVAGFTGLVVVDEAYMDFAEVGSSAIPLIRKHANLIVLRTFSKAYGLAGTRVGYCVGDRELIGALYKGKDIYNVNAVSAKLALAALKDKSYTERMVQAVKRTREVFTSRLSAIGFAVVPSDTNFVLISPPVRPGVPDARLLYAKLTERNIHVRYFEHLRLADKLRISIGTDADMELLWSVLTELVQGGVPDLPIKETYIS